ncbi:protein tyrosine phosphatase family protein [Microbulbifer thermotolerans]|uniref:Beta-lactamase hydrolase-like protein phosphatase-like domain-containing protein n=1 Tax=Microbulbifer thermotolerans TaxID=252514 RepID=A0A143HLZ7_MICTH|nr:TIGR01244 family sulfur transferase [Microbulbifer thermotolerans]AMX02713.1 hypothetical protein A3224_09075 [Microbulbifer thermotolerans]MCX2805003.1 TIGR01244 family sulfur transferase [Microbulbifer thermotolerans]
MTTEIKYLDEQVSVSEQLDCDAVARLALAGVELVVCNRQENESEDQPTFAELEKAARENGMEFIAIPFARGQMTLQHCREFSELLASGKRIHAFCRTGNRSCNLWAVACRLKGAEDKSLLASARAAGFEIRDVLVAFDAE